MNYRHAFHAGNFADVVKHIILTLTIESLKKKPKAFRVIDTHAGCGLYNLMSDEASRTLEWQSGIGRLVAARDNDPSIVWPDSLEPYFSAIEGSNPGPELQFYPGSPVLAALLLRESDKLIVNELHPEDVIALRTNLASYRNAKVMFLDAWTFLKSALPPPERRGVVLIDPPFEQSGEIERMVQGLVAASKRFATGVYLLWYPIKNRSEVARLKKSLRDTSLRRLLAVEVFVAPHEADSALVGTGLILHNPPFGLQEELSNLLPFLMKFLSDHSQAEFDIQEIAAE